MPVSGFCLFSSFFTLLQFDKLDLNDDRSHLVGPLPYLDENNTLGESLAGHYNVNSTELEVDRAMYVLFS